jgi:hypothetical protein
MLRHPDSTLPRMELCKWLTYLRCLLIVVCLYNRRPVDELSPEERDARTVFCMQLSQRIRARDLEEFFSSVGKVCIFLI